MSSSIIPSLNPDEHLDRPTQTNTQIHKKVPTHKHLFLVTEARVGHTSTETHSDASNSIPQQEGFHSVLSTKGGNKRHPVKMVATPVRFIYFFISKRSRIVDYNIKKLFKNWNSLLAEGDEWLYQVFVWIDINSECSEMHITVINSGSNTASLSNLIWSATIMFYHFPL